MKIFRFALFILLPVSLSFAAQNSDSLTFSDISSPALSIWAVMKIFFLLAIVIALILAAVWALKKLSPNLAAGKTAGVIRILSSAYLGPKRAFILVEVLDRIMLVGITETDIALIAEFNDPQEVAEIRARAAGKNFPGEQFSSVLTSFFKKK